MNAPILFFCLSMVLLRLGYPQPSELKDATVIKEGPLRVLFLGHESEQHPSDEYFPVLAQALGPEAIYFDYVTTVEDALGDLDNLNRFDALLLYANRKEITPDQWEHLNAYINPGGGFLPIHCASCCFQNEPGFNQLVGGRFAGQNNVYVS